MRVPPHIGHVRRRHLFVESGSPDWLDEAHARGAAALLLALLREYGKGE